MDRLRKIFCALFDHPPVVHSCFGYITCARCDEQLGDSLGGAYVIGESKMVVGHSCETCDRVKASLTWRERLLTPLER